MKSLQTVILKAAFVGSLGLLGAGSAMAATIVNLGTLSPAPVSVAVSDPAGPIADVFNFTISPADTNAALSSIDLSLPNPLGGNLYHITNFAGIIEDSASTQKGSLALSGGSYVFTGNLMPGNYSLDISGTADGSSGGLYVASFAAVPVPEASTALSAIAGLGLLALVTRGRRLNQI